MTRIRASLRGVTSQIATSALPIVNGFLDKVITNLPRLQNGLRSALGFLQVPLGWLTNTVLPLLWSLLSSVGEIGVRIWNSIRDAVTNASERFEGTKPIFETVKNALNNVFEFARPAIDFLIDNAIPFLVDALAGVLSAAMGVANFFMNNWGWIAPIVAGITGAVLAYKAAVIAVNVVERIRAGISTILKIKTVILTAKQWLWNVAMSANPIGIIILAIGALIAIGVALWMNWDKVVEWITGAWEWLKDAAVNLWNSIKDFFVGLWENIKGIFVGVWESITGFLSNAWDKISGTAIAVFEGIKNAVLNIWNGIWNGIKGIINLILGGINGLIRGVVNGVNGIINGINRVTGFVGIPAIPTLTAPQIPLLAKGGVIQQAGRVIVGDAGPEFLDLPKGARVTPLDRAKNEDGKAHNFLAGIGNAITNACGGIAGAVTGFLRGIVGGFDGFDIEIAPISELVKPMLDGVMRHIETVITPAPIFEMPKPAQDDITRQSGGGVTDNRRVDAPTPRKEPQPTRDKRKAENKITINVYADGKSCDEIVDDLMPKLKLALANL